MAHPDRDVDVLFFGSQGSNVHFTSDAVDELKTAPAHVQQVAQDFLSACFKAFQTELSHVDAEDQKTLGRWTCEQLDRPESLVNPPALSQRDPVVESVSLYIHQVLDLLRHHGSGQGRPTAEAMGVCSGMIPAVLAAAVPPTPHSDFLDYATDGLRLAFWVGVRTSLFCHRQRSATAPGPMALTILGLSSTQVAEKVEEHNRTRDAKLPLRISATLQEKAVSVVGETHHLDLLKRTLPPGVMARYPHIHGYFHGGPAMEPVVAQVMQDVERRNIRFPTCAMLQAQVRSAATGEMLQASSPPLVQALLEHIFVHRVDWPSAWRGLQAEATERKEQGRGNVRVVFLGPNTSPFQPNARSTPAEGGLECATTKSLSPPQFSDADIAIVGMSVEFPEGSGKEAFWDTLKAGRSTVRNIPSSRFDSTPYYRPDMAKKPGRWMAVKHGNFLDDPFAFDNAMFNISPREARSMDPQQRLLLQASLDALEDAGYQADSTGTFLRQSFGVFVGVATGDYVDNLREQPDVYYSPGTLRAFLAGRISYAFGFKGPSVVVDTACSSSLVAIHQACRALQAGDCSAALAGGVNVISSPDMYLGLARAHFLNEAGQCKAFDAGADGYTRAEGCGVVILKRLNQALAEGDNVMAVIRGVELNQCGEAKSITHPDAATQSALFARLFQKTRVDPGEVGVVEAHGTGTQAGDAAENTSLRAAFAPARRPGGPPLYLGSVKGNIGHAEAASGMAGLAKLVLALEHDELPPQASFSQLNPKVDMVRDGMAVIPRSATPWPRTAGGRPRMALLNNFGAAGSNAALLLGPPPAVRPPPAAVVVATRSGHVLNISARTATALEALRAGYIALLSAGCHAVDLQSLCYSANARRVQYDALRISATGATRDELVAQLREAVPAARSPRCRKQVVFVFSGQGGVHEGMGAELLGSCPVFGATVRLCDSLLASQGFPPTEPYISGGGGRGAATENPVVVPQCALFVLQYALAQMWKSWCIEPAMVAGHSLGEFAALVVAGALALPDALRVVAKRAELMSRLCAPVSTGMLACGHSSAQVMHMVSSSPDLGRLAVSCENGPEDTVIGGPLSELQLLAERLKSRGVKSASVPVPFAYHSSAMDPMLEALTAEVASLQLSPLLIPMGSGLHGKTLMAGECLDPAYFVKHCREHVKFKDLTENMAQTLATRETDITFLEVGPSSTTVSKMKWAFEPVSTCYLPSLKIRNEPWRIVSQALQALFLQGHRLDWRQVYDGSSSRYVPAIPHYPLEKQTFVVPYVERAVGGTTGGLGRAGETKETLPFDFLDTVQREGDRTTFTSRMAAVAPFIQCHVVGGAPLCPASIYTELALAAVVMVEAGSRPAFRTISDVGFRNPFVYREEAGAGLSVTVEVPADSRPGHFTFVTTSPQGTHCTGSVKNTSRGGVQTLLSRKAAYVRRQRLGFLANRSDPPEVFSRKTIYDLIFPRVVAYSGSLVTLQSLAVSGSGFEGYGTFQLPALAPGEQLAAHPALIDTMLHAAGFMANVMADANTACICSAIEAITVPTETSALHGTPLEVYCSLLDVGNAVIADAYTLNTAGEIVAWVEGCSFRKLSLPVFRAQLGRVLASSPEPAAPAARPRGRSKAAREPASPTANSASPPKPTADAQMPSDVLYRVIHETTGLDSSQTLSSDTGLESLGIDSLLLIDLGDTLLGPGASADFSACVTIGDIEAVMAARGHSMSPLSDSGAHNTTPVASPASRGSSVGAALTDTPSRSGTPASSVEKCGIAGVFLDVFGLDVVGLDWSAPIVSFGVDSLGSMELADELQARFQVEVLGETVSELTLRELDQRCRQGTASDNEDESEKDDIEEPAPTLVTTASKASKSGVVEIQAVEIAAPGCELAKITVPESKPFPMPIGLHKPGQQPFYLFHDGSGKTGMYERLALSGYNLFGVYSLDFEQADPSIQALEALAALYIEKASLLEVQNAIFGWSFGGVLAFEVARQIRARGGPPAAGLVLIDSPYPVDHEPLPAGVVAHVVGAQRRPSRAGARVAAQFARHAAMLGRYRPPTPAAAATGPRPPAVFVHCTRTFDTEALCGLIYPWLSSDAARSTSLDAWAGLLGGEMRVATLGCHHFDVFKHPYVGEVSRLLQEGLDK